MSELSKKERIKMGRRTIVQIAQAIAAAANVLSSIDLDERPDENDLQRFDEAMREINAGTLWMYP